MTYVANGNIQAADYNSLAGLSASAAASAAAASAKIGFLYGIGFGDRGYGQTSPVISAVAANQSVGQEWQNLRTVMVNIANWQGTNVASLPASTAFAAGQPIVAHSVMSAIVATLDANRLNSQLVNMSLTSAASSTRNTTWGSGGSQAITAEFQIVFSSTDQARYFFNSGGQFRIQLSHPNVSSPRDVSWNTVLNSLNVSMGAHSSNRISGSYGTAGSIGYYELTSSYANILNGINSGIGAYTTNDFQVQARVSSAGGSNGANGSTILIRAVLSDEQTNAFSDLVNTGTVCTLQMLRPAGTISVTAPSISVTQNF